MKAEALVVIPKVETDGAKVEVLPLVQCRNCAYANLETVVDHQDYFCCTINRACHFGHWFCADGKRSKSEVFR